MIVVTAQYRLGPLGFLFLGDGVGVNTGLEDAKAAIEWVKRNAHSFGGDPKAITVSGQDAGGVLALEIHKRAPGLFNRLIIQVCSTIASITTMQIFDDEKSVMVTGNPNTSYL